MIEASLKKLFHFFYDLFMTAELQKKNADQYTFLPMCLLIRETASASDGPEKLFSTKSHAGVIYLTYTSPVYIVL